MISKEINELLNDISSKMFRVQNEVILKLLQAGIKLDDIMIIYEPLEGKTKIAYRTRLSPKMITAVTFSIKDFIKIPDKINLSISPVNPIP